MPPWPRGRAWDQADSWAAVHYGAGRHAIFLTDAQIARSTEVWLPIPGRADQSLAPKLIFVLPQPRYLGNLASIASSALVKSSLVMQELRIFTGKGTRVALWGILVAIVIYSSVCFVAYVFICQPISAFWEQDIWGLPAASPVRCVDFTALYCQSPRRP